GRWRAPVTAWRRGGAWTVGGSGGCARRGGRPGGTRSARPVDRSSGTATGCPAARSRRTTCAPLYPAPPVTSHISYPVLSTLLLNWNRVHLLEQTLHSYRSTVSVEHEVIVVDNASTDGS